MISRSSLFACILAASALVAAAQTYGWTQFTNSPSGTTRHDDIYFLDETLGWASRGNGLIHKTIDGGATWTQVLSRGGTHFRCIGFASADRGWAGNLGPGSFSGSVTDTNVLFETFDGGMNWSVVPGINETGMKGLCALHVLDDLHIYGGGRVRGPAHFLKSTDGGTNWTVLNLTGAGVMGAIMDIYFHDPLNGFVVGMDTNAYATSCGNTYHGRIARTVDGGQTWTPVVTTEITCAYFWKMSWPSRQVGYATLQQNGSYSNIVFYKTTDGGVSWTQHNIPLASVGAGSFFLQGIGFVSETEGWMGGSANNPPTNYIHTMDGGETWSAEGYTNTKSINRIRFLNPTFGYASGQKLQVFRSPLAITSHPQGQMVEGGGSVQLDVAAIGDTPIHYQWIKDGAALSGATNATLTLSNVARIDSGLYAVGVTNAGAGLSSSNALVRVRVPQRLSLTEAASEGGVRLLFQDADGGLLSAGDLQWFQVLASSDLENWVVLTNALSLTNGFILFEDAEGPPHRFYRVVEN